MSSTDIRREDVFIYALYSLDGSDKYILIEEVYKKAHELLPSAFSWNSYPEIPSDRKANMALQHIREQKGKAFIVNSKNHTKLKLSIEATNYINEKKSEIETSLKLNPIKYSTRSGNVKDLKIIHDLHNLEYVSEVINGNTELNGDKILSLLKISSLSPVNINIKKINNLIESAKKNNSNEQIINFLEMCRKYYE